MATAAVLLLVLGGGMAAWLTVGRPATSWTNQIAYLAQDEAGIFQLYVVDPLADEDKRVGRPVTTGSRDVLSFAVDPAGERIAFSRSDESGAHDLLLVALDSRREQPLVTCEDSSCIGPVWSPDGTRIVYERRTLADEEDHPGEARLWWVDVATGETVPVFENEELFGLSAAFSADGRWLAFVVPLAEMIMAVDLEDGTAVGFSSRTGEPPVWGDGQTLYYTDLEVMGESLAVHLMRRGVQDSESVDLTGPGVALNDGSAAWDPVRRRLVFSRKAARTAAGRQIWVMTGEVEGEIDEANETARMWTTDADFHHGLPNWSADGRYIVTQRFEIAEPFAKPAVWVIDTETDRSWLVIGPGYQPQWIP